MRDGRPERDPLDDMSIRAVAEAQSLFVLGAGHGLANVCVRALALHPDLRASLSKRLANGLTTFPPFSNDRVDWIGLNQFTARHLRAVATESALADVVKLAEPVAQLGESDSWGQLLERRGEDFHRWRPQTHGLAGVTKATPWKREKPGTRSLGFGTTTDYVAARDLAEETAGVAASGMMALAEAMRAFGETWPDASGALGGPRFRNA
jgi:hypothetical protein